MLIPQIDIVPFSLRLVGHLGNKLDRLHRAGFHASLFSTGTAFLVPVRSVNAQVTLGGFAFDVIPDSPVRPLGAHGETGFASDAFFAVDPSDIAVLRIDVGSANGAIFDARRRLALPAGRHLDVVWEFAEGVLHDLDA